MEDSTAPAVGGAATAPRMNEHERKIFAHITETGLGFKILMVCLAGFSAWGLTSWIYQLIYGLGVTGMYRPVYWGIYITNFVFFIGVSHAGTLISAILRLSKAEWRRSITRMAEVITVLVISFGAGNIVVDMGRPERALFVFLYPNFRSPLIWDVCSITLYFTASTTYLLLPLIPDIVRLKKHVGGWRKPIYDLLSFGYTDTPKQRARLEKAIGILMVGVIPVAVSVHTVISWVFAMTIQPMWHSTIFGPYFVAGAIFSGIAAILSFLIVLRKVYKLEDYLKPVHLDYLGKLLLVMTLFWLYFTFSEYLTTYYGHEPQEMAVFNAKLFGPYAPQFWTMVCSCFCIPFLILCRRATRSSPVWLFVASISVNIGMYLERYTIVVPTLINPRVPITQAIYHPSWVEWGVLAGTISTFILLYLSFIKIFPIISVWEVEEGIHEGIDETRDRVASYYPMPESDSAHTEGGAA